MYEGSGERKLIGLGARCVSVVCCMFERAVACMRVCLSE